jgi:glycerol-3-phosphate dehydrogenase subunit C
LNSEKKVVYYTGCFVNYYDQETGLAVLKIMQKNGYRVEVPKLPCCSIPMTKSGDFAGIAKRGRRIVDELNRYIESGWDLIYSCPSCGYALRELFPELLESKAASLVAKNAVYISTYLLNLIATNSFIPPTKEVRQRVFYHTPCHLRSVGQEKESADLLRIVPGLEVLHIDRGCCGMGGTWAISSKKHSDISAQNSKNLIEEIKNIDPDLISTDCGGCKIQLARQTGYNGNRLVHPMRIFADAYHDAP